jgi:hypothetical protein
MTAAAAHPVHGYCSNCRSALEGRNLLMNGLEPGCRQCWESKSPETDHTVRDPQLVAADQVGDALAAMDRPLDSYVHFPFRDVDQLVGAIPPGDVGFIAAFSGLGKTTFIASAIEGWIAAGKRVYCLPLESVPHAFRTHLACKKLGLNAGDVLTGQYPRANPDRWPMIRKEIKCELARQYEGDMADRLYVSPTRRMDTEALAKGAKHAAEWGADIFVIDHIDHITGEGKNLHADTTKIVDQTLDLTLEYGLATFSTTQLNHEGLRGSDRLGMYQCPQPHHLYMGGKKRHIASWMIGLFRPLKFDGVDKATLAAARTGKLEAWKVLEPNCMGVGLMKSRHYGERVSQRAYLTVENGAVKDMNEADAALIKHGRRGTAA